MKRQVQTAEIDVPDSLDKLLGSISATGLLLGHVLDGMSGKFVSEHDQYCVWLERSLREGLLHDASFSSFLEELQVDWITIHYRTRHPREAWASHGEWVQLGLPIGRRLCRYQKRLQVYEGQVPPYFRGHAMSGKRQSALRVFMPSQPLSTHYRNKALSLSVGVTNLLARIVRGQTYEDDQLTHGILRKCRRIEPAALGAIRQSISRLVGRRVSEEKAIEMLANVCRVTFLALQLPRAVATRPRMVMLTPVYVGENIVGGAAFTGCRDLADRESSALVVLAETVLSRIRLHEEVQREASSHEMEALNAARAEFVQRAAHSIMNPLESLWDVVEKNMQQMHVVRTITKGLRSAASDLITAFAPRQNINALTRVKPRVVSVRDFVNLLRFVFGPSFEKVGKKLGISDVPKRWVMEVDRTALYEVFGNLLTNARRFARRQVLLSVEKKTNPARLVFIIFDDGPGVPKDIEGRLFRPGVFAGRTDKLEQKTGSHGYGLFLGKKIVEKHSGGKLEYKRTKRGTEFVVELAAPGRIRRRG